MAPGVLGKKKPIARKKKPIARDIGPRRWTSKPIYETRLGSAFCGSGAALCAWRCKTFFMAHYLMDSSTDETRRAFLAKVRKRLAAV